MTNRRRYYSGQLMPPPGSGAELSDAEFEVLISARLASFYLRGTK